MLTIACNSLILLERSRLISVKTKPSRASKSIRIKHFDLYPCLTRFTRCNSWRPTVPPAAKKRPPKFTARARSRTSEPGSKKTRGLGHCDTRQLLVAKGRKSASKLTSMQCRLNILRKWMNVSARQWRLASPPPPRPPYRSPASRSLPRSLPPLPAPPPSPPGPLSQPLSLQQEESAAEQAHSFWKKGEEKGGVGVLGENY